MRRTVIAVAIMASLPIQAAGQYLTGDSLLTSCQTENSADQQFCIGYISGIVEGIRFGIAHPLMASGEMTISEINDMSDKLLMNCPPEDVQNSQYVDAVIDFLEENPNDRHLPARLLIFESLRASFPCQ